MIANVEMRDEDLNLAKTFMKKNCGNRKDKVLKEGEVVIGSETKSSSKKYKEDDEYVGNVFGLGLMSRGGESQNQNSSTTYKKEWQLEYKCI